MLFFLLSAFVPFDILNAPSIPRVDKEDPSSFMGEHDKVLLVDIPEGEEERHSDVYNAIEAVLTVTNKPMPIFISSPDARFRSFSGSYGNITLMRRNQPPIAVPVPMGERHIISSLERFMTDIGDPIEDEDSLYKILGDFPYTLLCRPNESQEAIDYALQAAPFIGPVDVRIVTQDLLRKLGFENASLVMFRDEDESLSETELTLESVLRVSLPIYRILTVDDLENELCFAITAKYLTNDIKEFLFEFGKNEIPFVIGFIPRPLRSVVSRVIGREFSQEPDVAFVHLGNSTYFQLSMFDSLLNKTFNTDEWLRAGNEFIRQYNANELIQMYPSEDIPTEQISNVTKVVGLTYRDFINDPEHDVVMFYMRPSCPHCRKFIPTFEEFADECHSFESLKFGMIDIDANAVEGGFPFNLGVPHLVIFPAKAKADNRPIIGERTRGTFITFINQFGSTRIPLEASNYDPSGLTNELYEVISSIDYATDERRNQMIKYADEISRLIEIFSPKTEEEERSPEL